MGVLYIQKTTNLTQPSSQVQRSCLLSMLFIYDRVSRVHSFDNSYKFRPKSQFLHGVEHLYTIYRIISLDEALVGGYKLRLIKKE